MNSLATLLGATALLLAKVSAGDLFNGKDFTGWKLPEQNIWWKVEGGSIVVENGPKKRGSILWTEKSFRDFEVQMDFKCSDDVDSGVFLRTENQQIQIGMSGSLRRDMTCSPYLPGHGYPAEAGEADGTKGVKNLLKSNEWNALKIRAEGPAYTVWLNGTKVLDFNAQTFQTKKGKKHPVIPTEGPIGLQLHGNKVMKMEFRRLTVTEL